MEKSRIAGILSIVSGSLGTIMSLILLIGILVMSVAMNLMGNMGGATEYRPNGEMLQVQSMFGLVIAFYALIFIVMLLTSVMSIIGGVFALKKKRWGIALAGSICSVIAFIPCGVAALIFFILGKDDFQQTDSPSTNIIIEQ
jgi:hypothetical protein